MGTLRQGGSLTVTRLDTSFAAVTETLSYDRGMRAEIAGGVLAGTGSLIAPAGTDGRGGVINRRGTLQPGQDTATGTLMLSSATESTTYTQTSGGTLAIHVLDSANYGKLTVNGASGLDLVAEAD